MVVLSIPFPPGLSIYTDNYDNVSHWSDRTETFTFRWRHWVYLLEKRDKDKDGRDSSWNLKTLPPLLAPTGPYHRYCPTRMFTLPNLPAGLTTVLTTVYVYSFNTTTRTLVGVAKMPTPAFSAFACCWHHQNTKFLPVSPPQLVLYCWRCTEAVAHCLILSELKAEHFSDVTMLEPELNKWSIWAMSMYRWRFLILKLGIGY